MQRLFTSLLLTALIGGCGSLPLIPENSSEPKVAVEATSLQAKRPDRDEPVAKLTVEVSADVRELYNKALKAMAEGSDTVASAFLFEVIERESELAGPWVNLSILAARQADSESANEFLATALSHNPSNCDALSLQGIQRRVVGKFNEAEASYLKCIRLNPNHLQARLNLGVLYELYMGRYTDALIMYEAYQLARVQPDAKVNGWMVDLERRLASQLNR